MTHLQALTNPPWVSLQSKQCTFHRPTQRFLHIWGVLALDVGLGLLGLLHSIRLHSGGPPGWLDQWQWGWLEFRQLLLPGLLCLLLLLVLGCLLLPVAMVEGFWEEVWEFWVCLLTTLGSRWSLSSMSLVLMMGLGFVSFFLSFLVLVQSTRCGEAFFLFNRSLECPCDLAMSA